MKQTLMQFAVLMAVAGAQRAASGGNGKHSADVVKAGMAVGAPAATAVGAALNMEEDAGAGTEGADADSYAIPFLLVLQPMSPAVVDGTIEGAKPGVFMNSVTNQLYGESVIIVPCAFQRRWIRWAPRETGGGFKGELSTAEVATIREKGEVKEVDGRLYYPLQDGSINEKKCDKLVDTRSHFCLVLEDKEGAEIAVPAVLALTSTNIKTSKNLLSRIDGVKLKRANGAGLFTPASYSHMYQIRSVKKTNDKGTWWPVEVTMGRRLPDGAFGQGLYTMAKAFNQRVTAGNVTVAHESVINADDAGIKDDGKF